ncbi:hypothetical protein LSH36_135g05026 [Paralvinella palmiformis]|uniref:Nucleoporin Nup37 n=1 Tax=Paralvinella palmiformis TaxID=53620 RepID=A0AAD9JW80_9ANNE|nr:hypothetical protein LSH36_135g05026 [Paralvinella palmiformis]
MPADQIEGCYKLDCCDIVQLVEFCHFEWASHILALATPRRLIVVSCKFPDEDPSLKDIDYNIIKEFNHDTRITALAWSPVTSILSLPAVLRVYTSGSDHNVYVFNSDLETESTKEVIGSHSAYINAIAVHPSQGEHIATVSDDLTCRVWSSQGEPDICFPLTTPGVAVSWHSEQPEKLMVAEKKGLIRFYNIITQQPVMSLDCGNVPLMSADWCPTNVLHVACIAASDWFVFDTSRSSSPLESKPAHTGGCTLVRWSRLQRHLLATTGQPNCQVKVISMPGNQTLLTRKHVISSGLSWHYRLPLVAVGGDKKVHFYKV